MKTFRGPIQRYPGMPSDSSDDEEDEDVDYYVQPVFHIDDVDDESGDDENDRFQFNLVFNTNHNVGDDVIEVGLSDDDDPEDFDTVFSFNSSGEPDRIILSSNNSSNSIDISVEDVEMSFNEPRMSLSSPHIPEDDDEVVVNASPSPSSILVRELDSATPTIGFSPSESNDDDEENPKPSSSSQLIPVVVQINSNNMYPEIEILRKPANTPPESSESSPVKTELTNMNADDEDKNSQNRSSPSMTSNLLNCDYSDSSNENTPRRRAARETPNKALSLQDEQESMDDDDDEEFCNPMISQLDTADDPDDTLFRGDRIGSTTYCERHVLKTLMNWVAALPKLASNDSDVEKKLVEDDDGEDSIPYTDRPLQTEFEESMSLLWDMTTEKDVMDYLIEKNIFGLIRDTLDTFNCPTRLKEIALGILANILSCSSILEEFPEKDDDLHLVERIVMEVVNSTKVPLLTQVFAVLRRVVCYIRNAKPLERWMKFLLHEEFINAANFLLASSTNVLLLGDVIMTLFTLMEVLSPPHEQEKSEVSEEEKIQIDVTMTKNFLPICQSNFVPSICEGLNELLKDSRTNAHSFVTTAHQEPGKIPNCETTGNGPDVYNRHEHDGLVVPPGHIQTSILNGLASLCYLQKFEDGQNLLKQHCKPLTEVLIGIFKKFKACTEIVDNMDTLDYFALAMDILGFCHKNLDTLQPSALIIPAKVAILLTDDEKKSKLDNVVTIGEKENTLEIKSSQVSPYVIIFYNYLISLEEKFNRETIKSLVTNEGDKVANFYSMVRQVAEKVQQQPMSNESEIDNGG